MNFTISTPNQTATLTIFTHHGKARMDCSFWPMAQASFFRAFEEKYEVQQVSANPTRTSPSAGTVYFRPTREQQSTLIEDIEALFSELYEY